MFGSLREIFVLKFIMGRNRIYDSSLDLNRRILPTNFFGRNSEGLEFFDVIIALVFMFGADREDILLS